MTLYEFLKETKVDVRDIDNFAGNNLDSQLAMENRKIDFDKDIDEVTDDELYQIGSNVILYFQKSKIIFREETIEFMRAKIEEVKIRVKNNNNVA